jgi:hypothetical protein
MLSKPIFSFKQGTTSPSQLAHQAAPKPTTAATCYASPQQLTLATTSSSSENGRLACEVLIMRHQQFLGSILSAVLFLVL